MDKQRLGQAFRDAVQELPPASFEHGDVVAASRRATARRRGMFAGGTLLGVAVLVGGLVAGELVTDGLPTAENAAPAPGDRAGDSSTLHTLDAARCGPIDTELVADLAAVLANRGSVASGPASEVPEQCPAGSRAAAVPVPGGVLQVLLFPQSVWPEPVQLSTPDGSRSHVLTVNGGRQLMVISTPSTPGQPPPLADEVPDLARELAARQ